MMLNLLLIFQPLLLDNIFQILNSGEQLGLKHFKPVKPLGSGDTGRFDLSYFLCINFLEFLIIHLFLHKHWCNFVDINCSVHLVELCDSGEYFAMKAMDKGIMLNRNKVFNIIFSACLCKINKVFLVDFEVYCSCRINPVLIFCCRSIELVRKERYWIC